MESLTERGIAALRAGDSATALALLKDAVRERPEDAAAWLWLAGALDDPARQRYCLERALALNPASRAARQGLAELEQAAKHAQAGAAPELAPASIRSEPRSGAPGGADRPQPIELGRHPHLFLLQAMLPWFAAALAGVSALLAWAAWAHLGASVAPLTIVLTAMLWGAPLGLACLVLGGVLLRTSGSWLGGRAGAATVRAALGWAAAPAAWGLLLWGGQLALMPAVGFGGAAATVLERVISVGCWFMYGGLWLWTAVRAVRGLAAAHGFTPARAIAACALAALAVVATAFTILGAAALVIGLRGG